MKIIIEPLTLILQLNRYEYDRNDEKVKKKNDAISCSETVKLPGGSTYSLSSVVNHNGSTPEEGHYNILLSNPSVDKYVLLDDTYIKFLSAMDKSVEKLQYLITYVKI